MFGYAYPGFGFGNFGGNPYGGFGGHYGGIGGFGMGRYGPGSGNQFYAPQRGMAQSGGDYLYGDSAPTWGWNPQARTSTMTQGDARNRLTEAIRTGNPYSTDMVNDAGFASQGQDWLDFFQRARQGMGAPAAAQPPASNSSAPVLPGATPFNPASGMANQAAMQYAQRGLGQQAPNRWQRQNRRYFGSLA
jgi:hypothetical protein